MTIYTNLETMLRDMVGYMRALPDIDIIPADNPGQGLLGYSAMVDPPVVWKVPICFLTQRLVPEFVRQALLPTGNRGDLLTTLRTNAQRSIITPEQYAEWPVHNPPTLVVEIYPYDEQTPRAMASRVCDYMAHLEALDWKVETVLTNPRDSIVLNLDASRLALDAGCPEGHVNFSAGGFLWGPLPLTPLEVPATWPFPARTQVGNKALTLKPTHGGRRMEITLPLGESSVTMQVSLPWQDAIRFASMVRNEGWERAMMQYYPHGVRVRLMDNMPGDEVNKTQVVG